MKNSREMREEERAFLERELNRDSPSHVILDLKIMIFPAAVMSFIGSFIFLFIADYFGFEVRNGAWHENALTFWSVVGIVVTVIAFCGRDIWRRHQWEQARQQEKGLAVRKDIDAGRVNEEFFEVSEVKVLQEPEHGMCFVFLKLSGGKVFAMVDYDSVDDEMRVEDAKPSIAVRANLHLIAFPKSKLRKWSFSGDILPLPPPTPMGIDPDRWPEDETFIRVKWHNIEKHYGGKKAPHP